MPSTKLPRQERNASVYAAAQQVQTYRRLRRWLPLRQTWQVFKTCQVSIKAWLTARRPGRISRREWLALGLAAGLTLNGLSQPLVALAQGPVGGEFQVNTYTTRQQSGSSVGMDADGDFVIAWSGRGSDDWGGIYAQRYSASGYPKATNSRSTLIPQVTSGFPA